MTASIRSIRKRLLECLDRPDLERLSRLENAHKKGRSTLIEIILNGEWSPELDNTIQAVVNKAKAS